MGTLQMKDSLTLYHLTMLVSILFTQNKSYVLVSKYWHGFSSQLPNVYNKNGSMILHKWVGGKIL